MADSATRSDHNPHWFDPTMPPHEECVLGELLERGVGRHPGRIFAKFEDGTHWTYGDTLALSRNWAAGLRSLGVDHGDAVLVWLPNGPAILRAWFAIAQLGAVFAPINTAYRGELLEHVIRVSGARVLLAHASLLPRLQGIDLSALETVVALSGPCQDVPGVRVLEAQTLDTAPPIERWPVVSPWDTLAIIYTSGTTGPSKGVLCSHLHFFTVGTLAVGFVGPGDTVMVHMPLFHIGAAGGVFGALVRGAAAGIVDGFSTQRFWEQVRAMGCTTACGLVGSAVPFLSSRPAADDDGDQPLRRVLVAPVDEQLQQLARRHGFEYFTGFGMSEAPIPLVSELNPGTGGGYCGRPRSGVQCRIVDRHDIEVPPGTVGELVVRPDVPWSMSHGYVGNPQATAAAWRNGWFHTGDAFYRDADGRFFFVDRMKDAIRRRGENISSQEVEKVVLTYPGIVDAAAIPVPSEYQEDEVMIVVQPREGCGVDMHDLIAHLAARMAHFMVPRYVRVLAEMPRTATNKVQKPLLREQGVTSDTWDREAAGLILKRERLTQ